MKTQRHAKIIVDRDFVRARIDDRIFGSFIEHLGRAVYDGIYQPSHPTADLDGFRTDVIELVKELNVPLVRYPGGNFVSNYRWEDGIGLKDRRPRRLDLAWRSIETNQVGIDEFDRWTKKVGTETMMVVNLGTRGIQEACNLLDYCNIPYGTEYSELRAAYGHVAPYAIKTWCLGNEMDGPWQIGHKTALEYARLAEETAKAMRQVDPSIELVSCGSSHSDMPTYPIWEEETLDRLYEHVDFISMHQYFSNADGDDEQFLASNIKMDEFIKTVAATCDFIKAKHRSRKTMYIAFDEWNVWYHSMEHDNEYMKNTPWIVAPSLLEDHYTFLDALVVAAAMMTLISHADRVKIACLAQLVNVIAPIMTNKNGGVWKQSTFYPFQLLSQYGRGKVLESIIDSPSHHTREFMAVPDVQLLVTENDETSTLSIFLLNRNLEQSVDITAELRGFDGYHLMLHKILTNNNLHAINEENVERVKPEDVRDATFTDGILRTSINKASWSVLVFGKSANNE